uniref:Cilia- and flagella-associated protein 300 n=1 Tax=Pavo cristatus TaxID=9049 RepID=A0A8C9FIY9_PAVCR
MSAVEWRGAAGFAFRPLPQKAFPCLQDRDIRERLLKWSMQGSIAAQAFSFDQQFKPYQKDEFVMVVLNVGETLKEKVQKQIACNFMATLEIPFLIICTVYMLHLKYGWFFFVYFTSFIISLFHEVLLLEDSDHYDIFSESDRKEFLFCLFKHLCIGGTLCQFEDVLGPYLETTKALYKDLVSVQKNPETKEISITSTVFRVSAYDGSGLCYPSRTAHAQTFSYLLLDPARRHVHALYHRFGGGAP